MWERVCLLRSPLSRPTTTLIPVKSKAPCKDDGICRRYLGQTIKITIMRKFVCVGRAATLLCGRNCGHIRRGKFKIYRSPSWCLCATDHWFQGCRMHSNEEWMLGGLDAPKAGHQPSPSAPNGTQRHPTVEESRERTWPEEGIREKMDN